jgi:hypothetical protein
MRQVDHKAFLERCEGLLRETYTRVAHSTESIRTGKARVYESLDAVRRSRKLLENGGAPPRHSSYDLFELGLRVPARPHNGTLVGQTRAPAITGQDGVVRSALDRAPSTPCEIAGNSRVAECSTRRL